MPGKNNAKFVYGSLFGAVLVTIVGFSMGWVITSGKAQAAAEAMSEQAVKDHLVPICVDRVRNLPDSASKLEAMQARSQWDRAGYVTEQGWATMPGKDTPATGVARECAAELSKGLS